jgi:UDP-N-acetylmuramate--alanine ligase
VNRQVSQSAGQRIHLVGIGGIGLSAIAQVLAARGYRVSGSDVGASALTDALSQQGIRVFIGHAAEQVGDADLVVVSSAIPEGNPEVQAARARGIPVMERQGFLHLLLDGYRCLAVAGTHGKTTTSGMVAHILQAAGLDPSFIVGGILAGWGVNARAGSGEHFVIEADEYGRMFHGLTPQVAVITSIEMDHPDCYADLDDMRAAFVAFVRRIRPGGLLVACADGEQVQRLLAEMAGALPPVVTYGRGPACDYVTSEARPNAQGGEDLAVMHRGSLWARASLRLPGAHNALNATAALLVAQACGVAPQQAAEALGSFQGVLRRFELKGERGGVTVVDDYAHHPTEIAATLAAARDRYGARRIWAVLQPHTYSRTQTLLGQFAGCMDAADQVIVTDIYAARAKERPTVDAQSLVSALQHRAIRHLGALEQVEQFLLETLCAGDVLLTLGAGNGYLVGERVLAALGEREA